jgi:hypothetical protein
MQATLNLIAMNRVMVMKSGAERLLVDEASWVSGFGVTAECMQKIGYALIEV